MSAFAKALAPHQKLPDVTQITEHHLLIVGQTGSGKTTTTLSLLNQLQTQNTTAIVFDPTGEYTHLPNAVVYRLGDNAYFDIGKLDAKQLLEILDIHQEGMVKYVAQAIDSLRIAHNLLGQQQSLKKLNKPIDKYEHQLRQLGKWANSYPLNLLTDQVIEEMIVPYADQRATYTLLGQKYDYDTINRYWPFINDLRRKLNLPAFQKLFGNHAGVSYELNYILKMFLNERSAHKTLVIDMSLLKHYENSQGKILSLILQQLLLIRREQNRTFPVKIVIDEAHRYLPANQEALSHNGIFAVVREGRKYQLELIITTQSPLDLPNRLRSQFVNLLIHNINDTEELQSMGFGDLNVNELGTGEAYLKIGQQSIIKIKVVPMHNFA